jgi:CRISPR/Cas system-associated protein Cas10 (large subunit of type III CRISPR-Cas system)
MMSHTTLRSSEDQTINLHFTNGVIPKEMSPRTCEICGRKDPSVVYNDREMISLCKACRFDVAQMPYFTKGLIHRFLIGNVC